MQKCTLVKAKPKIIQYRCYKIFNNNSFRDDLSERLAITREYGDFEKTYLWVLDNHAPIKNKTIRANHVPYLSKALRKPITRRSNLENKYLNNRTPENKLLYRRQKDYCSRLYNKERKMYYSNLNLTKIKDNNSFWKTLKPSLTDKGINTPKITLIENQLIVNADVEVAESLNSFSSYATTCLWFYYIRAKNHTQLFNS